MKFGFCPQQNKLILVTHCCLSVQPLPKISTDECAVKTISYTTCNLEWPKFCVLQHYVYNYNMHYPAYTCCPSSLQVQTAAAAPFQ